MTSPGERIMDPEFGVGIRKYLFEPNDPTIYIEIESRIRNQVGKYLPFVSIESIQFFSATSPTGELRSQKSSILDGNSLGARIEFKIIPLGLIEVLKLP